MITTRVRGVNRVVRNLASSNDRALKASQRGCIKAANHLMEKIKGKFGKTQPGWAPLSWDTKMNKLRKYGFSKKPLIGTGAMKESFFVQKGTTKKAISATVRSEDEKLIHHIYGAPRANLPKRDPVKITAIEEKDTCHEIIEAEVRKSLRGGN